MPTEKRDKGLINDPLSDEMSKAIQYVYGHITADGLALLRKQYPQRYKEVYDELDNNWTIAGIKKWREAMERGLKKINVWVEEKQLTLV